MAKRKKNDADLAGCLARAQKQAQAIETMILSMRNRLATRNPDPCAAEVTVYEQALLVATAAAELSQTANQVQFAAFTVLMACRMNNP